MKPTLYVMCGIPGSGKSTFAKKYLPGTYVSRDEIRFNHLKPGENYFSVENTVWKEFIQKISNSLKAGHDTIADATHISVPSRMKLFRALHSCEYNVVFVVLKTPYTICVERNALREGRARVANGVIAGMDNAFTIPKKEDYDNCKGVWLIDGYEI